MARLLDPFAVVGLLVVLAAPATAQRPGSVEMLPSPPAVGQPSLNVDRAVHEKYEVVQFLFAEVKRLAAENDELRRQLAARGTPLPAPNLSPPVGGVPCENCRPPLPLGSHRWTSDEVLHPYLPPGKQPIYEPLNWGWFHRN